MVDVECDNLFKFCASYDKPFSHLIYNCRYLYLSADVCILITDICNWNRYIFNLITDICN